MQKATNAYEKCFENEGNKHTVRSSLRWEKLLDAAHNTNIRPACWGAAVLCAIPRISNLALISKQNIARSAARISKHSYIRALVYRGTTVYK